MGCSAGFFEPMPRELSKNHANLFKFGEILAYLLQNSASAQTTRTTISVVSSIPQLSIARLAKFSTISQTGFPEAVASAM